MSEQESSNGRTDSLTVSNAGSSPASCKEVVNNKHNFSLGDYVVAKSNAPFKPIPPSKVIRYKYEVNLIAVIERISRRSGKPYYQEIWVGFLKRINKKYRNHFCKGDDFWKLLCAECGGQFHEKSIMQVLGKSPANDMYNAENEGKLMTSGQKRIEEPETREDQDHTLDKCSFCGKKLEGSKRIANLNGEYYCKKCGMKKIQNHTQRFIITCPKCRECFEMVSRFEKEVRERTLKEVLSFLDKWNNYCDSSTIFKLREKINKELSKK